MITLAGRFFRFIAFASIVVLFSNRSTQAGANTASCCAMTTGSAAKVGVPTNVDLNGNGMSDIWELIFHAQGVDPNADPDGDGTTNLQESIAGTDPFNAN